MKKTHVPLFGLFLVALVAAAAIGPGALTRDGGATVEAFTLEESGATVVEEPFGQAEVGDTTANCRYGVATKDPSDHQKWVDDLGAGWWMNFQVNYTTPAENGAEFAHVIWVEQEKSPSGDYLDDYSVIPPMSNNSLGYLLQRRPGRMWIIGNEVDRGPDPGQISGGQGDTMPAMYARIYHDVYHYIKEWDPTALVTPSALVQVTPGRAQYLDLVWEAYQASYGEPMPVDLWNMHLYILPERRTDGSPSYYANIALGTDPALAIYESGNNPSKCALDSVYCLAEHDDLDAFAEQVVRMRTWMKDHGYQHYPLIITEYSLLLPYETRPEPEGCWVKDEYGNCFTPQRVRDFANASFNYMETAADPDLGYHYDNDRLVQQWMWYGMYRTGNFATSNLATNGDEPLSLTLAGQAFNTATRAEPATINLIAVEASDAVGSVGTGDSVSAHLSVLVRNNGNTRVNEPITLTFYRDEALTQVMGTTIIPAPDDDFIGMTGCAVRGLEMSGNVTWQEALAPGDYPFWVKVDGGDLIDETDETDNVASGILSIVPVGTFVPLVMR